MCPGTVDATFCFNSQLNYTLCCIIVYCMLHIDNVKLPLRLVKCLKLYLR